MPGGGAAPSKPTEAPAAEKPVQTEVPPPQPAPKNVEREIPTTPPPGNYCSLGLVLISTLVTTFG